jgi:uncharacterized alpha-E superfamily protein
LWFGRYLERAESTARVLHVTLTMALDTPLTPAECWLPVVIVSGEREHFLASHGEDAASDAEAVQRFLTWEREHGTSILCSVSAARDNARSIREVVSLEAWETVNQLYLWLESDAARAAYAEDRHAFYRRVRESVQLALGLLRSTMLHDTPLDFIWFGVIVERAGQTARVLDVHHHALTAQNRHPEIETAIWLSLLRACSGFEPYMKRASGRVSGASVAAFLLLEPKFPRSIRYCIDAAYDRLLAIRPPGDDALPGRRAVERFGALHAWIHATTPESLTPSSVHGLLTHVVEETAAVCMLLGEELFGYAPPAGQMQETSS